MDNPSASVPSASGPPAGLMHGGDVRFTIYTTNGTRPVQVWGPVTSQEYVEGGSVPPRVTSLRVSGARVFDGRLAELAEQASAVVPPSEFDGASYAAGAGMVLGMIGVLQPVDRAPSPAEQPETSDRFPHPDVDSVLATLTAQMQMHLDRHAKVMARVGDTSGGLDPDTRAEAAKHHAAGMALLMAIDVLNGVTPTQGTFAALTAA